jgi:hypothetical protein
MAVVIFNNGLSTFGSMCADKRGLTAPASSVKIWKQLDNKRVYETTRSLTGEQQERRKDRRKRRRRLLDAFEHAEGATYKSGAFHAESSGVAKETAKVRRCKKCSQPMKGHKSCTQILQSDNKLSA